MLHTVGVASIHPGHRPVLLGLMAAFTALASCGGEPLTVCNTDTECPGGQVCDPGSHTCREGNTPFDAAVPDQAPVDAAIDATAHPDLAPAPACVKDADCSAPTPRCDPQSGTCVRCLPANDHCPQGQRCAQSGGQWTCVDTCQGDPDCEVDGGPKRSCCAGLCIDTAEDISHCGACGRPCPTLAHTRFACAGGVCRIDTCEPGWDACSGNPADGCSTDVSADLKNCGGCGKTCGGPGVQHANATCAMGVCTLQCNLGFADCNAMAADGCEADLQQSNAHCGGCGQPCGVVNHQTSICKMGACFPDSCEPGWNNCTGDMKNPCNTFMGDPNHCGGCNVVCQPVMNAMPGCMLAGNLYKCGPGACQPGWGDCDQNAANGCEKSVLVDVNNCGACRNVCKQNGDIPACTNGKCGYSMCLPGNLDCNKDPVDGCEANQMLDPRNCGGCGVVCPAGPNAVPSCQGGQCVVTCAGAFFDCDKDPKNGCEVKEDVNNCGTCNWSCGGGQHVTITCVFHGCAYACDPGFDACDSRPDKGCNTDLNNDPVNCGKCRNACSVVNGEPSCVMAKCGVKSCNPGFDDCDKNPANGCEVTLGNDAKNCGKCGNACPMNAATCLKGQCSNLPRILLVANTVAGYDVDVQTGLMATGAFSVVDIFNAGPATPTLMQLQAYDAVLLWSTFTWNNPTALGDRLGDYWDGGGRVVIALDDGRNPIAGRFGLAQNGYRLIKAVQPLTGTADSLGTIFEPMSPLVAGVAVFNAASAWRSGGNVVLNGGIVVAEWKTSHDPLVVRGVVKGRNRVDLNFFPPSDAVASQGGGGGSWTGDGYVLLKNALLYK